MTDTRGARVMKKNEDWMTRIIKAQHEYLNSPEALARVEAGRNRAKLEEAQQVC